MGEVRPIHGEVVYCHTSPLMSTNFFATDHYKRSKNPNMKAKHNGKKRMYTVGRRGMSNFVPGAVISPNRVYVTKSLKCLEE
ncbi:hypothetical protein L195_g000371 [Trifolium pratense]|uniref:Uncharacterized protein n=1 Tax=Trifolium pratense TaxID=57577 RepID=A0A2K3NLQ6_TRIPR|nr:hypothetical protein L195_g000371 [Trifolium pratense]